MPTTRPSSRSAVTATQVKVVQGFICVWLLAAMYEKDSMKGSAQLDWLRNAYHEERDLEGNSQIPGYKLITSVDGPFLAPACFNSSSPGEAGGSPVDENSVFKLPGLEGTVVKEYTTTSGARPKKNQPAISCVQRAKQNGHDPMTGTGILTKAKQVQAELKVLEAWYQVRCVSRRPQQMLCQFLFLY